MPTRPHAGTRASWTILSVPVRTRGGTERLEQAYRRLLADPLAAVRPRPDAGEPSLTPAIPAPQTWTPPPCAPPSMPASQPSARSASRPSTASSPPCSAWAADHGHAIAEEHVFRDEGYSGARLDRPGLDALRDAVRDGAVEVVAVLSPDRLARKYAYQVLLLEEFRRAGCEVVFLQHPISDDPNDQLLLQIQGAIAEYERAVLGERFRRGKLQRARDGHYLGGRAPYGYRYVPRQDAVPGHLVVDEAEAELVRMLYGWLVEERTTIRQILKRLNAGPWLPRSGRHAWSPPRCTTSSRPDLRRHGLRQPLRLRPAGQAARAQRGPRTGEATCRRLRPREQWIAIPVPALVDQETWDRAQAQLARNAALSFRNNTKHSYLLRCLLTCESCGLAMYGVTTPGHRDAAGAAILPVPRQGLHPERPHRRLPEPPRQGRGDRAPWCGTTSPACSPTRTGCWRSSTISPPTAEAGSAREQAVEQQLRARLDRTVRADKRLLDAYQAGAISLAELSERRRILAERASSFGAAAGGTGPPTPAAPARPKRCGWTWRRSASRIHARLDEATFADKQAILQLVIERIIVGQRRLEIRHVIPLRPPSQPSNNGPGQPTRRLRSDGVGHQAPAPWC